MREAIVRDLLYGLRTLRKSPILSAAAILTLGLAIGASTAIFSVVRAVLLAPLPFRDQGRLVEITGKGNGRGNWIVYRDMADWREQCHSFESMGAAGFSLLNLNGAGEPVALYGGTFSSDLLETLGVKPMMGRGFLPSDDRPGHDQVVILSYKLWQQRFGGDPDMIGKHISLSGPRIEDREIIGVMPPDFNYPMSVPSSVDPPSQQREYWVPLGLDILAQGREGPGGMAVARLRSGVTLAEAQADIDTVAGRLEQDYPQTNTGRGVRLVPLFNFWLGNARVGLLAIWAATALVLVIGCVNVANLLLARATSRSRETGIRLALGADRKRLVRQWLTESVLMAGLGGVAGLALAAATLRVLLRLAPHDIPRLAATRIDIVVLIFSAGLTLAAGLCFGVLPAWRAAGTDPLVALKSAGGRSSGSGRAGGFLIAAEVALCVPLAIGAVLFVKSYARLMAVDTGFRPDNVLASIIILQHARYPDLHSKAAFYNQLIDRLEELAGVESAGAVNGLPLSGNIGGWYMTIEGHPSSAIGDERPGAEVFSITPDYLSAIGIPLLAGSSISRADVASGAKVVVVNDLAAAQFWPDEDPIGKGLAFTQIDAAGSWRRVIGVVKSTRDASMDQAARAAIYVPTEQGLDTPQFLAVRTKVPPLMLEQSLRSAVASIDHDQPVFVITSMQTLGDNSVAARRYTASMLSIFGVLALVLAAIGVYGVVSYSTGRRTAEIGLRVALGASKADVLKLVVGQGMVRAVAGAALGLLIAYLGGRMISSLLYAVSAADLSTYTGCTFLLLAITLTASYIPARRAARVNPMIALREE
jgi:putative ABC transport system permease protein